MQIQIKKDPTLQLPEIKQPMVNPGSEEDDEMNRSNERIQTKIDGIVTPLIRFNESVLDFTQVLSFVLYTNPIPEVELVFEDTFGIIQNWDQGSPDNILQVQILPPFDNAYKKINLVFYVKYMKSLDNIITLKAIYNPKGMMGDIIRAYGKITTYELFDKITDELQLGLASNIDWTNDARWIYAPHMTYEDLMNQEIRYGGDNPHQLLTYWIDFWNYINIVDVVERYTAIDKSEELNMWISDNRYLKTDEGDDPHPEEVEAMITNHPTFKGSPVYASSYVPINDVNKNVHMGTDKVGEFYNMTTNKTNTLFIQNGDVGNKKDINSVIFKYHYMGEEFGDTKYLQQKICHNTFLQKMNSSQSIVVRTNQLLLGLMKGHKVNFYWYNLNELNKPMPDEKLPTSNIPLPDDIDGEMGEQDQWILNRQVSGQYYIMDLIIKYNKEYGGWTQEFALVRPPDQVFSPRDIAENQNIKTQ